MSRDPHRWSYRGQEASLPKGDMSGLSLREQRSVDIRQGEAGAMSQEAELESYKWGKTWTYGAEQSLSAEREMRYYSKV